jgi:branched-chain amino acid transport system ATP-binding protein
MPVPDPIRRRGTTGRWRFSTVRGGALNPVRCMDERMAEVVISTRGVTKQFDGLVAANNVDFEIRSGDTVGIIGPNGAGKSTFFNLLTGLYIPDSGSITYCGRDITRMPPYDRVDLGIVRTFQLVSVFDTLTVLENMMLARIRFDKTSGRNRFFLRNLLKSREVDRCREALDTIGIADKGDVKVSDLPYGKKRELEIAIALSMAPKLLLLDEPLAGMSMVEITEIMGIIRGLKSTLTIVLVEHKISKILDLVDTLYVMHEGQIICSGEPNAVICNPAVKECYFGKDNVCY